MIKNKLLYRIFEWRFNRLHASFKKWSERFKAAEPLSKTRTKCLEKERKILRERKWLLEHMFPNI